MTLANMTTSSFWAECEGAISLSTIIGSPEQKVKMIFVRLTDCLQLPSFLLRKSM